jgi:hypothetical protein
VSAPKFTDVHDIVEFYLAEQKLDGLMNEDRECACDLADLAPCGDMQSSCIAGTKTLCDCGDHDFHITPKPTPAPPVAELCERCGHGKGSHAFAGGASVCMATAGACLCGGYVAAFKPAQARKVQHKPDCRALVYEDGDDCTCHALDGEGHSNPAVCPECGGRGKVGGFWDSGPDEIVGGTTCPACNGTGKQGER